MWDLRWNLRWDLGLEVGLDVGLDLGLMIRKKMAKNLWTMPVQLNLEIQFQKIISEHFFPDFLFLNFQVVNLFNGSGSRDRESPWQPASVTLGWHPPGGWGLRLKRSLFSLFLFWERKKESNKSAPYGAPDGVAAVDVHFVAIKIFFFSASLEVRKRFQETCDEIGNSKKKNECKFA